VTEVGQISTAAGSTKLQAVKKTSVSSAYKELALDDATSSSKQPVELASVAFPDACYSCCVRGGFLRDSVHIDRSFEFSLVAEVGQPSQYEMANHEPVEGGVLLGT
jgi:hypothetical protein